MFSFTSVSPTDRLVVITGCDSGFGFHSALALLNKGFTVIAGCLTTEGCERLNQASNQSIKLSTVQCDVTQSEDLDILMNLVEEKGSGKLWALVNNAGIAIPGHIDFQSMTNYRKVMEVNYFAPVNLTQRCMPMLKKARGRVVNITSACGIVAVPTNAPYNSAKYALEAYSDTLRRENKQWGIDVSIIEPGCMNTAIRNGYYDTLRKTYETAPQDIQDTYGDLFINEFIDAGVKGMNTLAQDPKKAIDSIIKAVSTRRPSHRYRPGLDAKFIFLPMSLLPSFIVDPMLNFSMGSAKPHAMQSRGSSQYEFSRVIPASQELTYRTWLQYAWKEGCNILTTPQLEDVGDEYGKGCNRKIPMFANVAIREGITDTNFPHTVQYRVLNPSWYTFPVNFHRGEINFYSHPEGTEVIWRVELTPKWFGTPLIWMMLNSIIPIYLKRLATLLSDPSKHTINEGVTESQLTPSDIQSTSEMQSTSESHSNPDSITANPLHDDIAKDLETLNDTEQSASDVELTDTVPIPEPFLDELSNSEGNQAEQM